MKKRNINYNVYILKKTKLYLAMVAHMLSYSFQSVYLLKFKDRFDVKISKEDCFHCVVCSKVWPNVWAPDFFWLLLLRFMEVREMFPTHLLKKNLIEWFCFPILMLLNILCRPDTWWLSMYETMYVVSPKPLLDLTFNCNFSISFFFFKLDIFFSALMAGSL